MHNTVYRLLIEGASGTKPQVTFPMLRQPGLKYLTTIIAYSSYSLFFLFAFFFLFFLFFSKILAFKLLLNSRLNKVMLCYVLQTQNYCLSSRPRVYSRISVRNLTL